MATKAEPSFSGRRLAALRAEARLTAEQLADLVQNPAITKTVITNLESGRKRDATLTEVVLLASALNVSVLRFFIDNTDPWGPAPFTEDSQSAHEVVLNVEFGIANDVERMGDIGWYYAIRFYEALINAERGLSEIRLIERFDPEIDPEAATGPRQFMVRGRTGTVPVSVDGDRWRNGLWEVGQTVIDFYREALERVERLDGLNAPISEPIRSRLDTVRLGVVALLRRDPDLDFGANDHGRIGPPPINPSTGLSLPKSEIDRDG